MAIDDRGQDTQRLFESVCRALGAHRQGAHFPKIATDIIRPTHDGYEFLGLADDGERAVYYDTTCEEVIDIPFDKHGLARSRSETVAQGIDRPQEWLTTNQNRMVWTVRL